MLTYPGAGGIVNSIAWSGTLVFALFLIGRGLRTPTTRAVGVYLLNLSMLALLINYIDMETDPAMEARARFVAAMLAIALPFLVAQLFLTWPWPGAYGSGWRGTLVVWAPILFTETVFLLRPEPWLAFVGALTYVAWFLKAGLMFVAFRHYATSRPGPLKESAFYVGLGLASVTLVDVVYVGLLGVPAGAPIPEFLPWALSLLTLYMYGIVTVAYVTRWRTRHPSRLHDSLFLLFPLPAIAGAASAAALHRWVRPDLGFQVWEVAGAVACAGGIALWAVAAVKYHSFGLDIRFKWVLRRGTVAAAFLSVFFLVFETAQQAIGSTTNSAYLGIAATALLVFLLSPLQRLVDRFADAAIPQAKPIRSMNDGERHRFYLDQARFLWGDGALSLKDRMSLDLTAQRLGLTEIEARRLERQAVNEVAALSKTIGQAGVQASG